MGALPKKKHTRYRISGRRNHIEVKVASLSTCPHCRSPKLSHRVCPICGYYRGREVITQEAPSVQT